MAVAARGRRGLSQPRRPRYQPSPRTPAITFSPDDEQGRDVVRLGEEPVPIRRPARGEEVVGDGPPVDRDLVQPERRDVQPRAPPVGPPARTPGADRGDGACRSAPGSSGQRDGLGDASRPGSQQPASTRSTGLQAVQPRRGRDPDTEVAHLAAPERVAGRRDRRPGRRRPTTPEPAETTSKSACGRCLDLVGASCSSPGAAATRRQVSRTGPGPTATDPSRVPGIGDR